MTTLTVEDCLQTFTNWPDTAAISAIELANAGFIFGGIGDRAICIYCRGTLHTWMPGDVIDDEHRRHFPHCPSLSYDDTQQFNIDVVTTSSRQYFDTIEEVRIAQEMHITEEVGSTSSQHEQLVPVVKEAILCRVCLLTERNTVLMPCFHLVLCACCRDRLAACPVCRQPITGSMKVFLS
jgi:hypothetical protein